MYKCFKIIFSILLLGSTQVIFHVHVFAKEVQLDQNKFEVIKPKKKLQAKPQKFQIDEIEELLQSLDHHQEIKSTKKIAQLSEEKLRRKIGQMIMVGFAGTSVNAPGVKAVLNQLRLGYIGGVMIMSHNVKSPRQLRLLIQAIKKAAKKGGEEVIISVDQEGGWVQRLKSKNGHIPFNFTAKKIAKCYSPRAAKYMYRSIACQLRKTGINLNFGPVVDIDLTGKRNPIIGKLGRSYGRNSKTVIRYANAFIQAHKEFGIGTVAKHFPGHGSSLTDSHKGFTSIPNWSLAELEPYKYFSLKTNKRKKKNSSSLFNIKNQTLLKQQKNIVDMVMVGHLYNPLISDGAGVPSSLSKRAIKGLLKGKVGYNGVVITDDMEMGAIVKNYPSLEDTVIKAVNAGNDILLYSNTRFKKLHLGVRLNKIIRKFIQNNCSRKNPKTHKCIELKTVLNSSDKIRSLKQQLNKTTKSYGRENCSIPKLKNVCNI